MNGIMVVVVGQMGGRMFQAERARGKREQRLFRDPIGETAWLEERGEGADVVGSSITMKKKEKKDSNPGTIYPNQIFGKVFRIQ